MQVKPLIDGSAMDHLKNVSSKASMRHPMEGIVENNSKRSQDELDLQRKGES